MGQRAPVLRDSFRVANMSGQPGCSSTRSNSCILGILDAVDGAYLEVKCKGGWHA
jgi:hypothetical protein